MDYVTRQFINLAKHFRKDLRKALSDLNGALHKQTEAIRQSNEAREDKDRPTPEIRAIVNLPESVEIHQNATDTTTERNYKDRTLFVSVLTLAAIVIYAVLVYLQYREMINATGAAQQAVVEARKNRLQAEKALKATIDQFHLEQRAWVIPTFNIEGVRYDIGRPIDMPLFFLNTGKTPARHVHTIISTRLLKADEPLKFRYDLPYQAYSMQINAMFPNNPRGPYTFQPLDETGHPILIDQELQVRLASGKSYVFQYGETTFDDIYGTGHWVKFCNYNGRTGLDVPSLRECAKFNDTDGNR